MQLEYCYCYFPSTKFTDTSALSASLTLGSTVFCLTLARLNNVYFMCPNLQAVKSEGFWEGCFVSVVVLEG